MNKFLTFLAVMSLLAACKGKVKNVEEVEEKVKSSLDSMRRAIGASGKVIDTIQLNEKDTAYLVKNKPINDDIGDKQKSYQIEIYFSNKSWPVLKYKNAIGADLFLTADLDTDGWPEILLRPEWFSSCWASVNLFSLKGNTWKMIKNGSMYFCADQYPLAKRIIKTEKGYGLLTDSLADDRFITLKKEIKF